MAKGVMKSDIVLVEADSDELLDIAAKFNYDLVKLHDRYARKLGIYDGKIEGYSIDEAEECIREEGKRVFLIKYRKGGTYVGFVVYSERESVLDGKCCYINNLYIVDKHRGKGIGKEVIGMIERSTELPIELSCYYELEAHGFYRKLGFVPVKTMYRKVW